VTWPAPPVRRSHLWVCRAEKSRYARIPPWRGVQRHSLRRRQTLEKTVEGAAGFINRSQTFAALIEKKAPTKRGFYCRHFLPKRIGPIAVYLTMARQVITQDRLNCITQVPFGLSSGPAGQPH
jgi:hypothetical protein